LGVLYGGVATGIPEAHVAAAVTLAIGIGIQNSPELLTVVMPLLERKYIDEKVLCMENLLYLLNLLQRF
jgi:zinc transporter ZupT